MPSHHSHFLSPESMAASGRSSKKPNLPALQSKMKCNSEGCQSKLLLLYRHFNSLLHLLNHQSAFNPSSICASGVGPDPTGAKDLGDMAMFLAHVSPFYLKHLGDLPKKLVDLLCSAARSLPSPLHCHVAQALMLQEGQYRRKSCAVFGSLDSRGQSSKEPVLFTCCAQHLAYEPET